MERIWFRKRALYSIGLSYEKKERTPCSFCQTGRQAFHRPQRVFHERDDFSFVAYENPKHQRCRLLNSLRLLGLHTRLLCHSQYTLNEQGFRWEVIEMQLAHVQENQVWAVYNSTSILMTMRLDAQMSLPSRLTEKQPDTQDWILLTCRSGTTSRTEIIVSIKKWLMWSLFFEPAQ